MKTHLFELFSVSGLWQVFTQSDVKTLSRRRSVRGLLFLCLFLGTVVEVRSAYIYWGQEDGGIRRANLDGTGQKTLATGFALGPTVDVQGGKMYWGDPINGVIRRAINRE